MSQPAEGPDVVAAVITDGDGRVFVQRRSPDRPLFPGMWDIVGGHREPEEDVLETLRREIVEETGWSLRRVIAPLGPCEWTGNDGRHRTELDYLVEVDGDLSAPRLESHKHDRCAWIDASGINLICSGEPCPDACVGPVVRKAFAALPADTQRS